MIELQNKQEFLEQEGDVKLMLISSPACGACIMMTPMLEKLQDLDGTPSFKIDATQNEDLVKEFEILSVPVTVVYKNNQPVKKIQGFQPLPNIQDAIKSI